ncbi:MAG: ATP-binding cassette domain-containing protein [Spirochaetales bacterium]|nr:ATP-binding cassette domain-containing protein [Spirochaetales bacterium]
MASIKKVSLLFQSVNFSYPSSPEDILRGIDFELFPGWYGLTGVNGSGKTSLMRLAAGQLKPLRGTIVSPPAAYCPQSTEEIPQGSEDFLAALYDRDNRAGQLFSLLKLEQDWLWRWETLSQGERKRFQLAQLLWEDRELLLVDEPTNHLDESSRKLILDSLKLYGGIGLVVSHDRDFMDSLCSAHLFLRNGTIRKRPGSLTSCLEEEKREIRAQRKQRQEAAEKLHRLEKEAESRRKLAESQQRRRSKAGLSLKDHDSRYKKNLARISGKDGTGGKLLRQLDGRLAQARKEWDALGGERPGKVGVTQRSTLYRGDRILFLPPGEIPLGNGKTLFHEEIILQRGQRVALIGDNGTGKTTLFEKLIRNAPRRENIHYIPQELSQEDRLKLRTGWEQLCPSDRGVRMSYFSRLGGNPESFLTTGHLSPGEERKWLFSFALREEPALLILDEPTNHLDLDSIAILEDSLKEAEIGLLLVSHDSRFRKALTREEWTLQREGENISLLWGE